MSTFAVEEVEVRGVQLLVESILTTELPPNDLVTAAFCLTFDQESRLLMVRLTDRDWHPTGGHRNEGETAQQAAIRETWEEGGCHVADLAVVGIQRITMLSEAPDDWPYPRPRGYQVFFSARIEDAIPCAGHEATEAAFVVEAQARQTAWVRKWLPLYEAGLASTANARASNVDVPGR